MVQAAGITAGETLQTTHKAHDANNAQSSRRYCKPREAHTRNRGARGGGAAGPGRTSTIFTWGPPLWLEGSSSLPRTAGPSSSASNGSNDGSIGSNGSNDAPSAGPPGGAASAAGGRAGAAGPGAPAPQARRRR